MREIFDQDRAMTLGAVKQATGVLGLLFLVFAVFAILSGLGHVFTGHVFSGLARIVGSLALLGFLYLVIRLLAEILAALHRLNDRLSIVGEDVRSRRETGASKTGADAEA